MKKLGIRRAILRISVLALLACAIASLVSPEAVAQAARISLESLQTQINRIIAGQTTVGKASLADSVPWSGISGMPEGALLPRGSVVMWYGPEEGIPAGWTRCDGTLGTPNLNDRFVCGATAAGEIGVTGGSHFRTLSVAQIPPHSHNLNNPVRLGIDDGNMSSGWFNLSNGDVPGADWWPTTNPTGGGEPFDNRPAFLRLYFIMKL